MFLKPNAVAWIRDCYKDFFHAENFKFFFLGPSPGLVAE